MAFYPGQHVVCVDDSKQDGPQSIGILPVSKGTIYTIRDLILSSIDSGRPGVRLLEIINPTHPTWGLEYGYPIERFRALNESRLDVFRAMLAPKPKQKTREGSNA